MSEEGTRDNRAGEDFMDREAAAAHERKRRFVNMREAMLDVLVTIEKEHDQRFAKKLKRRVLDSRSEEELRLVMDGMLVLAGFAVRPQPDEEGH